jgi:hypothetical protein
MLSVPDRARVGIAVHVVFLIQLGWVSLYMLSVPDTACVGIAVHVECS